MDVQLSMLLDAQAVVSWLLWHMVLNSAEFFIHHRTPHTFVYLSSRDKVSVHWANLGGGGLAVKGFAGQNR